jgi:hypothetical protein
MERSALAYFSQSFIILAQVVDQQVAGPNIIIEPMEPLLQKAVDRLKKMDPNLFVGVKKIVIKPSSAYGFVESGPGKDPSVININLSRIKQEMANRSEEEIIDALAQVIAHERAHIKSYKDDQGFVGGEQPAEAGERAARIWLEGH